MSKKSHKGGGGGEEHGGGGHSAPMWIVSFADLVTLLLSFFVIVSAGNPKDVAYDPEFAEIVAAIKKAFKYVPPSHSNDPVDKILLQKLKSLRHLNLKNKGGSKGKKGEASQQIEGLSGKDDMVRTIRTGSKITIGGNVFFDRLSAELTPEAIRVIRHIADQIRGHTNVFLIKGHTSKDEEYALKDKDVDLSYQRAKAVMNKLIEFGIDPKALRIQACRDYEPLKKGAYSELEKAKNRRAEVIATEALIVEFEENKELPSTPLPNYLKAPAEEPATVEETQQHTSH